jgi:hypothetical protein
MNIAAWSNSTKRWAEAGDNKIVEFWETVYKGAFGNGAKRQRG